VDHGQKVTFQFLVTCRQAAHVFHPAKEPLDEVPHGVDIWVMWDGLAGIGLGWDNRNCAFVRDGLSDRFAGIGLICNDSSRRFLPPDKGFKCLAIMGLRPGYRDAQWSPGVIYSDVNLTAATAA